MINGKGEIKHTAMSLEQKIMAQLKTAMLAKDEKLRTSLIQKANYVASRYTWDETARLLWQAIQKALV